MKPLISLQLTDARRVFEPGDKLECQYQVDAVDPHEIQAIEASVLWRTEGKGEEDLAVHFFRRRLPSEMGEGDLRAMDSFRTVLPNSPLSYDGMIVKIHWCVRLRVFVRHGKDSLAELRFRLGGVPLAQRMDPLDAAKAAGLSERTRNVDGH